MPPFSIDLSIGDAHVSRSLIQWWLQVLQTVSTVISRTFDVLTRPSRCFVVNMAFGYAREIHCGMTCSGGALASVSLPQKMHRRTALRCL